jgi:hypothetical protein
LAQVVEKADITSRNWRPRSPPRPARRLIRLRCRAASLPVQKRMARPVRKGIC